MPTPDGLPTPPDSTPLAETFDAIRQLATALGIHVQWGHFQMTIPSTGNATFDLVYDQQFAAPPAIVMAATNGSMSVSPGNAGTNESQARIWGTRLVGSGAATVTVHWIAVGRVPTT